MLIYAFLLILLLRPSWGLWGLFSIIAAALFVIAGFGAGAPPMAAVVGALVEGTIFCGLGALIVFLRLKFARGASHEQNGPMLMAALALGSTTAKAASKFAATTMKSSKNHATSPRDSVRVFKAMKANSSKRNSEDETQ
ncbi:MAG: hypothetical protein K2P58_02480 [Hyphomonadaceae bacterium]|nr:hypothetical protein [Hyphomonadaceae bacterium]